MIQNKLTTLEGVVIVSATCFNSSISTEAHEEPLTEYFRVLRVFFQNILHIFTKNLNFHAGSFSFILTDHFPPELILHPDSIWMQSD